MTIALCAALSLAILLASVVSYLEGIGENLWAAGVLAITLIAGWGFIIHMSLQDVA